ncbi:MAG: hypothetical protein R3D60_03345 [Paracoccaceae bacterium]
MNGAELVFDPGFGWAVVAVLGVLALGVTALSIWRGLIGWPWRALAMAVLLAALANPSLQTEDRRPLGDIAVVLRDETGSNLLSDRAEQTAEAEAELVQALTDMGVEARVSVLRDAPDDGGSALHRALSESLAEVPRDRLSGVFVLSDGLAHDTLSDDLPAAPVHLVQTGRAEDWDRRVVIRNAPAYGILGEELTFVLRIEDDGAVPADQRGVPVALGYALNGEPMRQAMVPVGRDMPLTLTLDHGGLNVLHFVLDPAPGELTDRNNQAVVQINGIRDRLRVLLVSGEPHTGQRTWRNLLKSDPAVDLVHFTILRPPGRQDGVPTNELSLIAFPTRELFIEKIDEFDLIIFDRYRRRGILPNAYFQRIREYVEQGGALLIAGGDELAGAESLSYSPLGQIMPAQPTARVFSQGFLPMLSDLGGRHPVTAELAANWPGQDGVPGWGRWLRQVELAPLRGTTIMTGIDDSPLLVLDRVGEGRIAVLGSDQAWLWDRGFEGGGPQAELLRRLAHWLMAESDLEEEALQAEPAPDGLRLTRRSLQDGPHDVVITRPDGRTDVVPLVQTAPGRFEATFPSSDPGLYRATAGELEALAVLGASNPLEFQRVVSRDEPLQTLVSGTQGGIARIDDGIPTLRLVESGRQAAGRGWLGIVPRGAYETVDLRLSPLLPAWIWLILAAGLGLVGWLREGRRGA